MNGLTSIGRTLLATAAMWGADTSAAYAQEEPAAPTTSQPAGPAQDAATPDASAQNATSQEQIQRWIEQLNADQYADRELATEKLISAGAPSIEPMKQALPGSNLEVTTRGVYVLRELALSGDVDTEEAARAALEHIALPRGTALARRAAATLATLDQIRQVRAAEQLEELGAKLSTPQPKLGSLVVAGVRTLEIGPEWKGEDKDLRRLKWLSDVEQVVLVGPQVTDAFCEQVGQMQNLTYVMFRRAKISDDALAHLKSLERMQRLSILYSPISDRAVDHLAAIKNVSDMRLYGTKITPMGTDRLQKALAGTNVDLRKGAFLGVSCDMLQQGCMISYVHPTSAAAEAGLQQGDIIAKYAGKKVTDFQSLTSLIAENDVGDTVKIEILRGDGTLNKEVTFGEWDD